MKRIFLCAGESSGDIHGSHLVRALRQADPAVVCEGLGGRLMAEAGMALRYDLASTGIMGFIEVLGSFRELRRLFLDTVRYLNESRPDCLVLIDYPGFNIRLAQRAAALGIPVVYYISPQVWAWKKGRIRTLARIVDKMLVILPFEEALYEGAGLECHFVGHPLLDHIAWLPRHGEFRDGTVIGVLPGSRGQEIARLLEPMCAVVEGIRKLWPEARFVVPCVDEARAGQIRELAGDCPLDVVVGKAYEVLDAARFCLVASGTATLEAALFGVPMVVMYKVAPLTYWLARRLVHVDHISLVNILMERRVVPEFLQDEARPEKVLPVALQLIEDGPERARMMQDLAEVRRLLGGEGASERAAEEILKVVENHGG